MSIHIPKDHVFQPEQGAGLAEVVIYERMTPSLHTFHSLDEYVEFTALYHAKEYKSESILTKYCVKRPDGKMGTVLRAKDWELVLEAQRMMYPIRKVYLMNITADDWSPRV